MKESGMIEAMAPGCRPLIAGLLWKAPSRNHCIDQHAHEFVIRSGFLLLRNITGGSRYGRNHGRGAGLHWTSSHPRANDNRLSVQSADANDLLLIGLTQIELADHQRFGMKYAFYTTLVMTAIAV